MFDITKDLEEITPYLTEIRRDFHRYPEAALKEYRTAQKIEEALDRFHIPHTRVGETGVLGILKGCSPNGKAVVLRADIDALPICETSGAAYASETPGLMHACGHDAHTACLLGAASILSNRRSDFDGEVRLVFQPAEEIGKGAKDFIAAGVMEGAQRVFGLHTAHDLPIGTVGLKPGLNNAAVDHFCIRVQGKSAHVSTPQKGVDAIYIASQIVVSIQALVTRLTSPVEPVIIGVGRLEAGTTYNALAETAIMEGTTRTVSQESREQVRTLIDRTVRHTAEIYGGTGEVIWTDIASALINDPKVTAEAAEAAATVPGVDTVTDSRELSLGGDNFSEFQLCTPGAYAYLGTGNPTLPNTLVSNHNGSFDLDEAALPIGAGLYAGAALYWLGK